MSEVLLEARDLCYSYEPGRPALNHVTAAFRAGERVAVLGGNGAGKSTFFLCCNGVLHPDSGHIAYRGAPVDPHKKRERMALRRRVGIVFQEPENQIIASTVRGEVSFGPLNLGQSRQEAARHTDEALALMGLEDFAERAPQYLSGGEKKRVTIADVLAMEPEILLFDEPAASLDPAGALQLEDTLLELSRRGMTLVVSTHDVDFAYRWAQRCLVFCGGGILADDTPEAIFSREEVIEKASLRQPLLYRAARALDLPRQGGWPRSIEAFEAAVKGGKA